MYCVKSKRCNLKDDLNENVRFQRQVNSIRDYEAEKI